MEYEWWLGMLSTINADNDLNESNVIEKIKEKLEKEDPGTYKEWQDDKFDIDYTFNGQFALLHMAAKNGYTGIVKALIEKRAGVNAVDGYGYTPLYYAAENGHIEVISALIYKGADISATDGRAFLYWAAENGHTELVNALVGREAIVDVTDNLGRTLLHYAAENGHTELVNALMGREAIVDVTDLFGKTPLHYAAEKGYTGTVKALMGNGAGVDAVNKFSEYTPLHYAAEKGHTETVKVLIGNGAGVDAVDKNKSTPLHLAAYKGHTETVRALIEKGADAKLVDMWGKTPLRYAVEKGHTEMVKVLIGKGEDVNLVDMYRKTLLHYAAEKGRIEMAKVLIEKGADVNARQYAWPPLHLAAKNGHTETVKFLIENGADIDLVDKHGKTPLNYAVEGGNIEMVKALIEKGAKVDAVDKYGRTLLHYAVEDGNIEMVKALIEKGANVNVLSKFDKVTPLYLAVQLGHAGIVKALMEKKANPLLGNKNHRTLKRLIELIKNNSSEHPRKAEETQQREEQVDDEYELLKYSLLFRNGCTLIDNVRRDAFDDLLCTWFADTSDLTPKRKELGKKLLSILKGLSYSSDCDKDILRDFLLKNKDDDDLKCILNLTRGESKLTILHVVSSLDSKLAEKYVNLLLEAGADPNIKDDRGKIPLHYASHCNIGSLIKVVADPNMEDSEGRTPLHCAAGVGDEKSVKVLLEHGADSSKKNKQGKIPLQVAIDNHNYHVEECFLTDNQKRLWKTLVYMVEKCGFRNIDVDEYFTDLEGFLSKEKDTPDFKRILNLRDHKGESKILLLTRIASCFKDFYDGEDLYEKAEKLLSKAGAINYKRLDGKEHSPKSGTLWDNLILNQQQQLKVLLDQAQDVNQLEQIVNKAIESGVRFNSLICPGEMMYQDTYNFTDYVIKRISELKKNPKIASDIVCKLVSKGAELHNLSSIDVIDTLESEFKDHKINMRKAREEHVNNTLEFMEIVKNAATGRVKNAKMDNTTFYLEYSEDSKIDVAKITDGARDLGLTQGKIEYGRDIIRIGKSEVELITENGIRDYINLADNSNIEITFSTSLGKLEVNLSPDKQDKDKIIVEVNDQGLLERLKNCNEKIGQNCSFGGLSVNKAIEQGFFVRFGKLHQSSETISTPKRIVEAVKGLQCGDIVNSSLSDITLSSPTKESIKRIHVQGA